MGECLGVCTGEISPTEYKRQVIRPLVTFLKGGKRRLIGTLTRRMKKASSEKKFEEQYTVFSTEYDNLRTKSKGIMETARTTLRALIGL